MEKLLGRVDMREQFVSLCVPRTDSTVFKHWASHLRGLRWECIVKFCADEPWMYGYVFHRFLQCSAESETVTNWNIHQA